MTGQLTLFGFGAEASETPARVSKTRICTWCRVEFKPVRPRDPYCGNPCATAARNAKRELAQLNAEQAKKAEGQSQSLQYHSYEAEIASREMILYLGALGAVGTAIVSDVRVSCEKKGIRLDWTGHWVGGLFAKSKLFLPTGEYRPAYHPGSRGRPVRVYRLSDEGRAELARLRDQEAR